MKTETIVAVMGARIGIENSCGVAALLQMHIFDLCQFNFPNAILQYGLASIIAYTKN